MSSDIPDIPELIWSTSRSLMLLRGSGSQSKGGGPFRPKSPLSKAVPIRVELMLLAVDQNLRYFEFLRARSYLTIARVKKGA